MGLTKARLKWLYSVVFGAFGYIAPIIVYRAILFEFGAFALAFIPSLVGWGIGVLVREVYIDN